MATSIVNEPYEIAEIADGWKAGLTRDLGSPSVPGSLSGGNSKPSRPLDYFSD